MSLDDLPKIRGLDVYIWNVGNVEKNAFYSFVQNKTFEHLATRIVLKFCSLSFSNFAYLFANM